MSNAIISNNQSKDFNHIMMFTCQEQSSSLQFTCNLYYCLRIEVIFTAVTPLHSTDDGLRKSTCVTGRCFHLFTSNAKHVCVAVFWINSLASNIFVVTCLKMSPFWCFHPLMHCIIAKRWQNELHRNAMLSSPPSFLICVLLQVRVTSCKYVTGTCTLRPEVQYCDLRCLNAFIFD